VFYLSATMPVPLSLVHRPQSSFSIPVVASRNAAPPLAIRRCFLAVALAVLALAFPQAAGASAVPFNTLTINNPGSGCNVTASTLLLHCSFTDATKSFDALPLAHFALSATALLGYEAPQWQGTDHDGQNPTSVELGVVGSAAHRTVSVTCVPTPVCVPTGGGCDLTNPGACCSQTCGNLNPPAPPVCF
jgi:hypothetical protein